jgi:Zn-dependent protease with chaperone function
MLAGEVMAQSTVHRALQVRGRGADIWTVVASTVPHRRERVRPVPPAGPSLTGRAFLALAFLFGFYVLAFAAVGLLAGANVVLFAAAGRVQAQLVLVTLVVAAAVLRGVFFVTRSGDAELTGVAVDGRSQPALVGLVGDVARAMGTAPPTRILLVPEVNAAVTETGGLLGLRRGERVMVIGVPLIEAMTVDQLRGVIAHELGHYAGGDTRLGALTYRAGASIYRTVDHLGHGSLLGRLFSAYGRRYLALSLRVRRQQELTADAAAVRLAGRENHVTALRRVAVGAVAFDNFIRLYLAPLWRRGCDVENAFAGYRALLADPGRAKDLEAVEAAVHGETTDRYDSHPSLAERVANAERVPEGPGAGSDGRPARELLVEADDVERRVGALLTKEATGRRMERVVDWGPPAAEIFASDLAAAGHALMRAAAVVAEEPEEANLAGVIVLIEEGEAEALAAAITGPLQEGTPEERAEYGKAVLRDHLAGAIGAYLTAKRRHSWAVSWSGPVGLVDGRGKRTDPFAMASSLLDDPSSGPELRRALGGVTRLRAFRAAAPGADPAAPGAGAPAGGTPPAILSVVPEVKAGSGHYDLLLTTAAVVLHPVGGGIGPLLRRAMTSQGVAAPQANAARRRIEKLFSLPEEELLGRRAGALVIPFERLVQIRRHRRYVVELELAGAPRPWRLRCPSKEARDALLGQIQAALVGQLSAAA